MNGVAAVSIALGIIIIVSRAPLIFAPEATRSIYLKLLATNTRIRIMGLFVGAMGIAMILSARGSPETSALLILAIGYFLVFVMIFPFMIFTSIIKLIAEAVLSGTDDLILRGMGVIAVIIGALFIWLGISII